MMKQKYLTGTLKLVYAAVCLSPVSYTHLDVYKRQVLPLNYTRLRRMKKLFYLLTKIRLCYYTHISMHCQHIFYNFSAFRPRA